jgi:hypothetical protein
MSKRIFTKEQVEELLLSPGVKRCSKKSITYRKEFKLLAIKQYQEGLPPSVIFGRAGFNTALIGSKTPKWCLERWRKVFRKSGEVGLRMDKRGGNNLRGRPKDMKNFTDKEKIRYLEAKVAYLREENRFLAKLRKKS